GHPDAMASRAGRSKHPGQCHDHESPVALVGRPAVRMANLRGARARAVAARLGRRRAMGRTVQALRQLWRPALAGPRLGVASPCALVRLKPDTTEFGALVIASIGIPY